jgi:hypothetical protein
MPVTRRTVTRDSGIYFVFNFIMFAGMPGFVR